MSLLLITRLIFNRCEINLKWIKTELPESSLLINVWQSLVERSILFLKY